MPNISSTLLTFSQRFCSLLHFSSKFRNLFDSSDPLRMYAAFRIWNGYLVTREYRERDKACDRFMDKMNNFTMAFQQ